MANLTRRDFLQTSVVSAGIAVASAQRPASSPAAVLGANDRINVGIIGVGGIGTHHMRLMLERQEKENIRVATICDVYQRRLSRAFSICRGEAYHDGERGDIPADPTRKATMTKADTYLDYRRMLDRKDIDAVFVCTPDHWHAKIDLDALDAGKAVYTEKPMTLTIEQALAVRDAVRRTRQVLQVGPQGTSNDVYWKAQHALRDGRIGKVTYAQTGGGRNPREHIYNSWFAIDSTAGPDRAGDDYVDWDMWLGYKFGLAPKIPWNPEHFFRFRKYWAYSNGQASDLLYHSLAPMLLALAGPNGAYPRRATGAGGIYTFKDGRDIPDIYVTTLDYPDDYTIVMVNNFGNSSSMPTQICGRYGTITIDEHLNMKYSDDFAKEFADRNNGYSEVKIEPIPYDDPKDNAGGIYNAHRKAFFNAVRGLSEVHCNAELGAATMVGIKMGVDSYRFNKVLLWDAEKEMAVS